MAQPLRIGIEARAAADVLGGRGRYVRELLRALRALDEPPRLTLLTRTVWSELDLSAQDRWVKIPGSGHAWALAAASHIPRLGLDVLFTPTSHVLAALSTAPAVTMVHDPFAFDRSIALPRGAGLERRTLRLAARRIRTAICTSEATRAALETLVPRLAPLLAVVPLAAAPVFFEAEPGPTTRPYVLAPGTLEPRKNLPRLLEAFALADVDADLLLVGERGWGTKGLDAALERAGSRVRHVGPVSDLELGRLYAGAALVCYPSLAEGFGLPVLEAMAAGAPVLTSDRSALAEVAGDAAILADPTDVAAIAAGIKRGLNDRALAERGRRRAALFSWQRVARETLQVLSNAAE